jgi:diadenosine tetraphosphatase ApaH/serine/threonine PP2A family protein phosphatase
MRIAILSDLHANLEATNAVLGDAHERDCTQFVCLGDVVGYNANPRECLEIVRKMECPVVKGNHDEQASLEESSRDFNPLAEMAINWTRAQLPAPEKEWLLSLPLTGTVRDFSFVHATLDSPGEWRYVLHTHVAGAFVRDEGVKSLKVEQLDIEETKKYLINVGSVGQPRDGDWRAAYCIYHLDKNVVEQRRVEYDLETAQQKIIKAGLPRMLAERLKLGR